MAAISVNGAELFALEEGRGEPLVLVHGSLADYRTWLAQVREFSRRHLVIAYSRRYHFPFAQAPEGSVYSVSVQAEDLAEVIRTRAGGRAHVVTSSYGGCVALCVALAHPPLIRSLVLCEPPLMNWLGKSTEGSALFPVVEAAQRASETAFRAGNPEEGVRLFSDMAIGPGVFASLPPRSRARMMDNAFELSLEMSAPENLFFPQFTCEELQGSDVPVLMLNGDRSPELYGPITTELRRCLRRAERRTIANAAHVIHGMNPADFSAAVTEFITHVEGS